MTPPREGYVAWRRIGAGAGVGLFILLGIGGLVGVVLLTERSVGSPVSGDTQVEPLVVPVRTEHPAPVAVVGVTLLTSEGASVRVWRSGVLTSLEVAVGVRVEAGDVVATVDDRPIVAMTADAPLHRDLRRGDAGPDVRRLQAFLGQLGLLAGEPDGQFGPQTAAAVSAFNDMHGLKGDDASFRFASVAWIGPAAMAVAVVDAEIGAPIGEGASLFSEPGQAVSVEVSEPLSGIPEAPGGHRLAVGEVTVPYVAGSGVVSDPPAVAEVAAALEGELEGAGQVVGLDTPQVMTVPATAVLTSSSGSTCVYPDVDVEPVAVRPVGGGVGTVHLPLDTPLDTVLANPIDVLESPTCG